jgi:hypothetical protein
MWCNLVFNWVCIHMKHFSCFISGNIVYNKIFSSNESIYNVLHFFWVSFLLLTSVHIQVAAVVHNRSVEMVEALYITNRVGSVFYC